MENIKKVKWYCRPEISIPIFSGSGEIYDIDDLIEISISKPVCIEFSDGYEMVLINKTEYDQLLNFS